VLKTVSVVTLGCKLNQVDGEAIRESFERAGYESAPFGPGADVYVVNTCTVTGVTDHQSRQLIRRALKWKQSAPGTRVVATGCYTQTDPAKLAKYAPGLDLLVGNADKERIPELLESQACPAGGAPAVFVSDMAAETTYRAAHVRSFAARNRAFLRVQDGCNHHCAYCIVPAARGPERSISPDGALAQAATFARAGYKELVVTGVHVGRYGGDLTPKTSLAALLLRLSDIPEIRRLRLSSIDPQELNDELYAAFDASREKLCPHFHISMQSCDDEILRAMRRGYRHERSVDAVARLRAMFPDASVGADIIVGFPGETDARFENTYARLESLDLSYMHIFRYSRRPGTPAAGMDGQVHEAVKKERSGRLHELRFKMNEAFRSRFIGVEAETLFESRRDRDTGFLTGVTRNYIRVFADAPDSFMGRLASVRLDYLTHNGIFARDIRIID